MTDITELAQSLKRRATSAKEFGESLYVKADDVLAMVEALECKEEQRANWFQMAQKLGEDLDAAEKRIAELESRTVKLPEVRITIAEAKFRSLTPQQHDAYNAGASRAVAKISQELTAQGIKVEAE